MVPSLVFKFNSLLWEPLKAEKAADTSLVFCVFCLTDVYHKNLRSFLLKIHFSLNFFRWPEWLDIYFLSVFYSFFHSKTLPVLLLWNTQRCFWFLPGPRVWRPAPEEPAAAPVWTALRGDWSWGRPRRFLRSLYTITHCRERTYVKEYRLKTEEWPQVYCVVALFGPETLQPAQWLFLCIQYTT